MGAGSDLVNVDPRLGQLQYNEGANVLDNNNLTHALLPGSPAINGGSNENVLRETFIDIGGDGEPDELDLDDNPNTTNAQLPHDQRGEGFNRLVDGTVDIGAYEVQENEPEPNPKPIDRGNQFNTPFFRFRNTQLGNNSTYIYVGEEEKNAILNDPDFSRTFELEGRASGQDVPAFIARETPGSDIVPINRYRNTNTSTGTYLFSTEEDFQKDSRIDQENFFNEGIAFYAYPPSSGSGSNFTRFENSGLPDTFVFQGAVEAASTRENFPGFIDQGETWAVETV